MKFFIASNAPVTKFLNHSHLFHNRTIAAITAVIANIHGLAATNENKLEIQVQTLSELSDTPTSW